MNSTIHAENPEAKKKKSIQSMIRNHVTGLISVSEFLVLIPMLVGEVAEARKEAFICAELLKCGGHPFHPLYREYYYSLEQCLTYLQVLFDKQYPLLTPFSYTVL